jgi:hypothetical protein
MRSPKENPLVDESLAAESNQGADDATALPSRLSRYSKAHHRAVEMAHYAAAHDEVKLSAKLEGCGSRLLFRHYYTVDKVRLHAAYFCKKHLLCPLCAIRRGAKMVKAYMDRLQVILAENPNLKPYLVTLTVKDGEDLGERFKHLARSVQLLHKARVTPRMYSEACKADGAVWSYEFKRGKNSGQWHPHVHAVWLCETPPDQEALSAQWKAITGDSHIVDIRPFHEGQDVVEGFLEVFKYAVKFSDLPLDDNWHGYQTLAGKRLIASFGVFRGVEVPEELTDEGLDDLPYVELMYKFVYGVGYSFAGSSGPSERPEKEKRPAGPRPALVETRPYRTLHLRQLQGKYGVGSTVEQPRSVQSQGRNRRPQPDQREGPGEDSGAANP